MKCILNPLPAICNLLNARQWHRQSRLEQAQQRFDAAVRGRLTPEQLSELDTLQSNPAANLDSVWESEPADLAGQGPLSAAFARE